jgi:hypothetical protein
MPTQLGEVKPEEFNIPDPDITPPKTPDEPNHNRLTNWFIGGLLIVLLYIIYKLIRFF